MDCWRLIEDPPGAGAFNMAADNSLFERHPPGEPPVLRLYAWNPPALSLGRNEKIDEKINLEFCRNRGIHVIRRMTGGKAVLHGSDLTYSVVGDLNDPQFGGGVLETYRFLAQGFFEFFRRLDLEPCLVKTSSPVKEEPHLCFSENSAWEILVRGRKLIGSAQRIRGSASRGRFFLQHGSIPLADPVPSMLSIFNHASEPRLRRSMISMEDLGVYPLKEVAELVSLLKESLAETFKICWDHQRWKPSEEEKIRDDLSRFRNHAELKDDASREQASRLESSKMT